MPKRISAAKTGSESHEYNEYLGHCIVQSVCTLERNSATASRMQKSINDLFRLYRQFIAERETAYKALRKVSDIIGDDFQDDHLTDMTSIDGVLQSELRLVLDLDDLGRQFFDAEFKESTPFLTIVRKENDRTILEASLLAG